MAKIKIKLLKEPDAEPVEIIVNKGTTVEELLGEYRSHLPYRIITARLDGDDVPLSMALKKDCELIFCDIRDIAANRTFQRGLSLLYMKAVRDLFGETARVVICNSVNRGLFTTVDTGDRAPVTEETLRKIEKRMWQLVDANLPIKVTHGGKKNSFVDVGEIDGCKGTFLGLLPSSTACLYSFALELARGGVMLRFPHPVDPGKLSFYKRDARIFKEYEQEQIRLDEMSLALISDLNKRIEAGSAAEIIAIEEGRHTERINALAQKILSAGKRIVLIAGPSSSGKTTTSKRLIDALVKHGAPTPMYLGTDDYFLERVDAPKDKNGQYNFEGLDAMDVELFVRNISELLDGKRADLPRYDFITGEKVFGERKTRLKEGQAIVVEGIHALNKKMSVGIDEAVKFKIYISPLTQLNIDDHNRVPSTDVRLIRRMIRDNRTRGRSVVETIRQWPKVRAGESVNIFPYNNEGDEIFNSTLLYELPILRKYAIPLLEEVQPGEAAYGHAKWLLYFLSLFTPIEDESAIPPESVLREFIGGSLYTTS